MHLKLTTPKRNLPLTWLGSTCGYNNEDIDIDKMPMVPTRLNKTPPGVDGRGDKGVNAIRGHYPNHSRSCAYVVMGEILIY